MSDPKYDFEIDLTNRNNGHTLMIELVGGGKRVLEVGCATGYMSKILTEKGCRVVGVELDQDMASRAKEYCEDVIVGDIESLDLAETLGKGSFEVVVFGDVLEHLRDPKETLLRIRSLLVPEGFVVASIPNVAHGSVRLSLLQGRFDYQPLGLLDDTHLRFFTKDSIEKLFRDAGYVVVQMERTTAGVFESEIELSLEEFPSEILRSIEEAPESTTYQFVVKAAVDNAYTAIWELHERDQQQRTTILDLQKQLAKHESEQESLRERITRLEGEVASRSSEIDSLRASLDAAREETSSVRTELASAHEQIEFNEQRWARLERRVPMRIYRFAQRIFRR